MPPAPIKIDKIEFWNARFDKWVDEPPFVGLGDPIGVRVTGYGLVASEIGPDDKFTVGVSIYDRRGWLLEQVEGDIAVWKKIRPDFIDTWYSIVVPKTPHVEGIYLAKVELWMDEYREFTNEYHYIEELIYLAESWQGTIATAGMGSASFTFSPPDGYAPLVVTFNDTSEILVPIISRLWDFGDGTTSEMTNPTHTYKTAGEYTVTLTLTTEYGVAQAIATIKVFAAPTCPVFEGCWFPNKAWIGEAFTPIIRIKNKGGKGDCYIRYVVEGIEHTLVDLILVPEFGEYIWSESQPIEWWLGYAPSESKMVNIDFKTGHVGEDPTSTWSIVVAALIPTGERANLYGIVQDKEGNPLADAAITLDSYSRTSAVDGSYSFADMFIGSYTIRCQREGYWDYEASVHLYEGDNQHNIVLTPTTEPPPVPPTKIPWKIIIPVGVAVTGLGALLLYARRK